ncbi:MAG: CotH kinase family protein [Clostridiales bacterium]|nr:CotH kinase family protein [Clostridiales bacterium]
MLILSIIFLTACGAADGAETETGTEGADNPPPAPVSVLVGIAVKDGAFNAHYALNENFAGAELTLIYEDGSVLSADITADMLTGFDTSSTGIKTVTVAYAGFTDTVNIFVTSVKSVAFDANGGGAVADAPVDPVTGKAAVPDNPVRVGFSFAGWYADPAFEREFDFNAPADADTLFAKWNIEYSALPAVLIDLEDGFPLADVDRENYINARVTLDNTDGEFLLDGVKAEFRGRGNGTWECDKKGYRIKFDKKQPLFGLEKNKHFVLFASAADGSFSRNNTAFDITRQVLDGIEYVSSHRYVDLYVNGNYHGVYVVFEQVRVDRGRVDIDSEYEVNNTGYLIEYDAYYEGTEGIDYFRADGLKYPFMIKSPDPEEYAEKIDGDGAEDIFRAQAAYIAEYVGDVVKAVFDGDFEDFCDLADIGSFVDMYILHELFKNTDSGWSSFFLYKKPGGKLYAGPPWDFDFTVGASRGDSSPEGLYVADSVTEYSDYTANELFIALMQTDGFVAAVKTRWTAVAKSIAEVIETELSDAVLSSYAAAAARDNLRWRPGEFDSAAAAANDYIARAVFVRTWLLARVYWLSYMWSTPDN